MQFWKTAFAILASVLLVGTQSVSAFAEKSPEKSQACGCCDCKKINCCMAQPTSAPEPIPATPVRAQSQNLQLIAVVASLLMPAVEKPAAKISFPENAFFRVAAVPLYEWNCSYLI